MVRRVLTALCVPVIICLLACGEDSPNIFHVDIVHYLDVGRDIEMVSLPGGTFVMGSDKYPAIEVVRAAVTINKERPVHFVSVPSFMISSTEITQEQYKAVLGINPSYFKGLTDLPVENLKWQRAADFCNELSKTMGLSVCYDQEYNCDLSSNGFRLPTEAEWEFAASGGTNLEYSFGDSPVGLSQYGWYRGNSGKKTSPVALREPNQYGLYDMHGNVSEWCQDIFSFYACNIQNDPVIVEGFPVRMIRGGSWASDARYCRSAAREAYSEKRISITLGFRIVRRP